MAYENKSALAYETLNPALTPASSDVLSNSIFNISVTPVTSSWRGCGDVTTTLNVTDCQRDNAYAPQRVWAEPGRQTYLGALLQ